MLGKVKGIGQSNLLDHLSDFHRKLILKDMALSVLVDASLSMDLNPQIYSDYLSNILTISVLDENGAASVERARYNEDAYLGASKLMAKNIIPYHCIYDELADQYYYLATDNRGTTDEDFFLQIAGYYQSPSELGNHAALCFWEGAELKTEIMDIDVHDGSFYIVEHYPHLRDQDGITAKERFDRCMAAAAVPDPEYADDIDYGEVLALGDPVYDAVYQASELL